MRFILVQAFLAMMVGGPAAAPSFVMPDPVAGSLGPSMVALGGTIEPAASPSIIVFSAPAAEIAPQAIAEAPPPAADQARKVASSAGETDEPAVGVADKTVAAIPAPEEHHVLDADHLGARALLMLPERTGQCG